MRAYDRALVPAAIAATPAFINVLRSIPLFSASSMSSATPEHIDRVIAFGRVLRQCDPGRPTSPPYGNATVGILTLADKYKSLTGKHTWFIDIIRCMTFLSP